MNLKKNKFYRHQTLIFLGNEDIEKVLVSKKISVGEKSHKYFIGYLYNGNKVKPLNLMLLKTSASAKSYDGQTKWIYFLIEDDGILEKYNTIWEKSLLISKKNLIASLSIVKII